MLNFITYAWKPFLLVIVVLAAAYGLRFLSYHLIKRVSRTHASYVSSALQIALVIGGFYAICVSFGVDVTVVLACIAIITAGVSLAANDFFGNAIAGAVLLSERNFVTGDQVTIGDTGGIVLDIGLTSVRVQSNTQGIVIIPSSSISGSTLINHSRIPSIEQSLEFVFFDTHDNQRAIKVMGDVLSGQGLAEGSKILHDWRCGSQTYAVVFKTDWQNRRTNSTKLSLALTAAFEAEKFPVGSVMFTKSI